MHRADARKQRSILRVVPVMALVATGLLVSSTVALAAKGGEPGPNGDKAKEGNHCVTPGGLDLNEFLGVSEQIVTSFCTEVGSGQHWTDAPRWFMEETFEVVPEGFVPAGESPLEDFLAKFVAVKYVIDPGTRQEKTVVSTEVTLFTANVGQVLLVPLNSLQPLSVGEHVVDVSWVFNSMHCDGIGDLIASYPDGGNCLVAGENEVATLSFKVTSGHN